jgi:hypothetical protein
MTSHQAQEEVMADQQPIATKETRYAPAKLLFIAGWIFTALCGLVGLVIALIITLRKRYDDASRACGKIMLAAAIPMNILRMLAILFVFFVFFYVQNDNAVDRHVSYSAFLNYVQAGRVTNVKIIGQNHIRALILDSDRKVATYSTDIPYADPDLMRILRENHVNVSGE